MVSLLKTPGFGRHPASGNGNDAHFRSRMMLESGNLGLCKQENNYCRSFSFRNSCPTALAISLITLVTFEGSNVSLVPDQISLPSLTE